MSYAYRGAFLTAHNPRIQAAQQRIICEGMARQAESEGDLVEAHAYHTKAISLIDNGCYVLQGQQFHVENGNAPAALQAMLDAYLPAPILGMHGSE